MFIERETLDDLLREVLQVLLAQAKTTEASRGLFKEIIGCTLSLKNPRARLSRSESKGKVFSALGEFLWYLSADTRLDFIDYYIPGRFKKESDDGIRVRSGYGDRLFSFRGLNQVQRVIDVLNNKPTSRRAVIQLFDASDLSCRYASIPCTSALQFLARDGRLHLLVTMRSNDAYIGFPHDVFSFTMLQELIARTIGLEVGDYKHFAGSLHLYEEHEDQARVFLQEGWYEHIAMPAMPVGDPWANVTELRRLESQLRGGTPIDVQAAFAEEYWRDLARLLVVYRAAKDADAQTISATLDQFDSSVYRTFAQSKLDRLQSSISLSPSLDPGVPQ